MKLNKKSRTAIGKLCQGWSWKLYVKVIQEDSSLKGNRADTPENTVRCSLVPCYWLKKLIGCQHLSTRVTSTINSCSWLEMATVRPTCFKKLTATLSLLSPLDRWSSWWSHVKLTNSHLLQSSSTSKTKKWTREPLQDAEIQKALHHTISKHRLSWSICNKSGSWWDRSPEENWQKPWPQALPFDLFLVGLKV